MHLTRMQEITPLEAAESRPFPTGAIVKEAWQICTTYFWPLTMAIFVIGIPGTILTANIEDTRRSFQFNGMYDSLVSGFVMIGVYRIIYLLKSEGRIPTFSRIYAEGNTYYGRNFRVSFLIGVYFLGIGIVITLLVLPCWALVNSSNHALWSYLTFSISLIAALSLAIWFGIRCMLYRAALADNASGARKAVESCMALTKDRVKSLIPLAMIICSGMLAWLMLITAMYMIYETAYETPMTKATEVNLMVVLDIPLAFWQAFTITALALTYLHLKQNSNPTANDTPEVPADVTTPV